MGRFIAVVHGWFVDSNGFEVHELKSTDLDAARDEAVILTHKRASTFDKCACVVVEIAENEMLKRKLTLRERLTGRTNP